MIENTVKVKTLQKHFHFEEIYSDEISLEKLITTVEPNRPGLELVGFYDGINYKQGIIIGTKETNFLSKMPSDKVREVFDNILSDMTPFVLFTHSNNCPNEILDIAKQKHITLLRSKRKGSLVSMEIMLYIHEKLSSRTLYHGTLIEMYGEGVLLIGDSGIGKSEIALELVKKGHRFVADDAVMVHRLQNHVYGQSCDHLKHLLEVRGIGLIDVYSMFGITAVQEYSEIDYVIHLTTLDKVNSKDRLQTNITYKEICGVKRPEITLPVTSGRSMANLVEAAVISLRLQSIGVNPAKDLITRYDKILKGGKLDE